MCVLNTSLHFLNLVLIGIATISVKNPFFKFGLEHISSVKRLDFYRNIFKANKTIPSLTFCRKKALTISTNYSF